MAGLMTSTPIGSYGIQACMGSSTGSALSGQGHIIWAPIGYSALV